MRTRIPLMALLMAAMIWRCDLDDSKRADGYFDLEISDSISTSERIQVYTIDESGAHLDTLYQGPVTTPGVLKDLVIRDYRDQIVIFRIEGFKQGDLAYVEIRSFDGKAGTLTAREVLMDKDDPLLRKGRPPILTLTTKAISIGLHDSVHLQAQAVKGFHPLKSYAWDYDGDGKWEDSSDLVVSEKYDLDAVHGFHVPGRFRAEVRVFDAGGNQTVDSVLVTVAQHPTEKPKQIARLKTMLPSKGILRPDFDTYVFEYEDTLETADSLISFKATPIDGGALITLNGSPIYSSGGTALFPLKPGVNLFRFTVTAADRITERIYSVAVFRKSNPGANLSALGLSAGKLYPDFHTDTLAYAVRMNFSDSLIRLFPKRLFPDARISLNGIAVPRDTSHPLPLKPGQTLANLNVVSGNDSVSRTYQLVFTRRLTDDSIWIAFPQSPLNLVKNDSARLRAQVHGEFGNLKGYAWDFDGDGGFDDSAAVDTADLDLEVGRRFPDTGAVAVILRVWDVAGRTEQDTIWVVVTGKTVEPPADNALLKSLLPSQGTMLPAFHSETFLYTDTVEWTSAPFSIKAEPQVADVSIELNGNPLPSDGNSSALKLAEGPNEFRIIVTALNGTTERTYVLNVFRKRNHQADLGELRIGTRSIRPDFHPDSLKYTVHFFHEDSVADLRFKRAAPDAKLALNGQPLSADSLEPIALKVGDTLLTFRLTAGDNSVSKTYSLKISRGKPGVAALKSLSFSSGAYSPAFHADSLAYLDTVEHQEAKVTLIPLALDSLASITVQGKVVAKGRASDSLSLRVGLDTVRLVVTAQDTFVRKTYLAVFYRKQNADPRLSALAPSAGTLSPAFSPDSLAYTLSVANSVGSITLSPTPLFASTMLVNKVPVNAGSATPSLPLTVGPNPVEVLVTAQDGKAQATYTLNIVRQNPPIALSGILIRDTVLAASNGPYTIAGTYVVETGSKLTLEPGTEVLFAPNAALRIKGQLVARGTAPEPIRFTKSGAENWGYILFDSTSVPASLDPDGTYLSGSILEHCLVEYGGGQSVLNNGSLRLKDAYPFLNNITVRYSKSDGLHAFNMKGRLAAVNSRFSENENVGFKVLVVPGNSGVALFGSSFNLNKGGGAFIDQTGYFPIVDIKGCRFIGNTTGGGLGGYVRGRMADSHFRDNGNSANGGGLHITCNNNKLLVDSCSFIRNSATGNGGGLYIIGAADSILVSNSILDSNSAAGNGGGFSGSGAISDCRVRANSARQGGGLFLTQLYSGSNRVHANEIASNHASESGGGIFASYSILTSNRIIGNDATSEAGGVMAQHSSVVENLIQSNRAANSSAAILEGGNGLLFKLNTVSGNIASGFPSGGTSALSVANGLPVIGQNSFLANTATFIIANLNPATSNDLDASNNWWNTTAVDEIDLKIRDQLDESSQGMVIYVPILTAPDPAAPAP